MIIFLKVYLGITVLVTLFNLFMWRLHRTQSKNNFKEAVMRSMVYALLWLPFLFVIIYEAITGKETEILNRFGVIELKDNSYP